jgi:hypothetical protein
VLAQENAVQTLLTRQFSLDDIKYDVYCLYHDVGLSAPQIAICDSHGAKFTAVKEHIALRGRAWLEGQILIRGRFEYMRERLLGLAHGLDRETLQETSRLQDELGIRRRDYDDQVEQGFGLAFETRWNESSLWTTFLSKGVWSICFFETICFVSRCPTKILRDERQRLHSVTEGAIQWTNGIHNYFIHGVSFPRNLWKDVATKTLSPAGVIGIENIEQRTQAIALYGYEKLLDELSATVLDRRVKNGIEYELFRVDLNDEVDGRAAHILKVQCPSTGRRYFLRVRPSIRKVGQALAWTFPGVSTAQYEQILIES